MITELHNLKNVLFPIWSICLWFIQPHSLPKNVGLAILPGAEDSGDEADIPLVARLSIEFGCFNEVFRGGLVLIGCTNNSQQMTWLRRNGRNCREDESTNVHIYKVETTSIKYDDCHKL